MTSTRRSRIAGGWHPEEGIPHASTRRKFAYFFAIAFPLYWARSPPRPQNVLLLAASYYFYACWDPRFLSLLVLSTVMDYACGLAVDRIEDAAQAQAVRRAEHGPEPGHARLLQVLQLLRREPPGGSRPRAGCTSPLAHLNVVLPIGISFYTFQSMSYVIDVYRRDIKPTRNLLEFAAFVSFFPHLVAGPIMRPTTLLPQIERPRRFDLQQFYQGCVPDLLGPDQEGRRRRQPGAVRQRPVRPLADDRRRPGPAGDLRLRVPDLLRLLGLHRRRPRHRQVPRLRAGPELQPAVLRHQPEGLLGALAHQPLDLAARLPVHPAGRQPAAARVRCSTRNLMLDDVIGGPLARRGLDVRALGALLSRAAPASATGWLAALAATAIRPDRAVVDRGLLDRPLRIFVTFHLVCLGWLFFRAESMAQAWGMLGAIVDRPAIPASAYLLPIAVCILPLLLYQVAQYLAKDLDVIAADALVRATAFYTACFYAFVWRRVRRRAIHLLPVLGVTIIYADAGREWRLSGRV